MFVVLPTLISMGAVYVRLVLSWAYRFGRRYIHKDNENTGFSDAFPWMGVRWKHSRWPLWVSGVRFINVFYLYDTIWSFFLHHIYSPWLQHPDSTSVSTNRLPISPDLEFCNIGRLIMALHWPSAAQFLPQLWPTVSRYLLVCMAAVTLTALKDYRDKYCSWRNSAKM